MSVSARSSLIMLDRCRIYSENRQTEVCISEPYEELYTDFIERINPYDAINDTRLWKLLEAVFHRKKEAEE